MSALIAVAAYVVCALVAMRFTGRALRHMDKRILGHAGGLDGLDWVIVAFAALFWPVAVPTVALWEYGGNHHGGRMERLVYGERGDK